MSYAVTGKELETDADGYLLEADFSEEIVKIIAASEGIELTQKHWDVINYLREEYKEHGATPNFRNMLKGVQAFWPEADSKSLYDLFPIGPSKQACKVGGLPQPLGKGGY